MVTTVYLICFQGCHTGLSHTPGPWRAVQPWRLAESGVSSPPWVCLSVVSPGPQSVNTDRGPTDKERLGSTHAHVFVCVWLYYVSQPRFISGQEDFVRCWQFSLLKTLKFDSVYHFYEINFDICKTPCSRLAKSHIEEETDCGISSVLVALAEVQSWQ